MITRRCTQRQFLMRPDEATNNAFTYCLAEAAQRHRIDVILPSAMSNHHHTVVFDRHGTICELTEHFHKMFAKTQNAIRGRWENFWSTEQVCTAQLVERADVMRELVYAATNPVKDGLVERVDHWPGVNGLAALLNEQPMHAHRPKKFFRANGKMPKSVTLNLVIPSELGDPDEIRRELRAGVEQVESNAARKRLHVGAVLGRQAILRQSWRDAPTSREPRRTPAPQVAVRARRRGGSDRPPRPSLPLIGSAQPHAGSPGLRVGSARTGSRNTQTFPSRLRRHRSDRATPRSGTNARALIACRRGVVTCQSSSSQAPRESRT
jgi:REP element-mobilizing transposase RayT